MRRVVVSGLGIISPIGNDLESVKNALVTGRSGIRAVPEWSRYDGLGSLVAGIVDDIEPSVIDRSYRRTMGRVGILATLAANNAVAHAALSAEMLNTQRAGVSMGSTTGSSAALEKFFGDFHDTGGITKLEGTLFMKVMSSTVAVNVAAVLGTKGRVIAPCNACASSTQAIGLGYEAIRYGSQDIMICGGADELHPSTIGVFDALNAASRRYNNRPNMTPRPFDRERDGLVISEGAAVLVLEDYEHAIARRAKIYGEVLGYATNCNAAHMTQPCSQAMLDCMRQALDVVGCRPENLDYINAHATGTELGDKAEAEAIRRLVGEAVPVSSTKGHTGHTLAACGAMEAIFCLMMMQNGFIFPTFNLDHVDPDCSGIAHVTRVTKATSKIVMSSNFAFGGVNASLVLGNTDERD
ncbi:MAG: beta-ketoacyl-ACP synthase [Sedimentisphaerales bacterium]|nr:beta-ketoacyl-ACP synthase [Sedimentisphaerales bacterium]